MKKIALGGKRGKDKFALVDDEDYERVNSLKWYVDTCGYARNDTIGRCRRMHNLVMGEKGVDHINRDKLDNRRTNLRKASQRQNTYNNSNGCYGKSQYKGVQYLERNAHRKWVALARKDGKIKIAGYFRTETEAALAYNRLAVELYGEFAYLNNIEE